MKTSKKLRKLADLVEKRINQKGDLKLDMYSSHTCVAGFIGKEDFHEGAERIRKILKMSSGKFSIKLKKMGVLKKESFGLFDSNLSFYRNKRTHKTRIMASEVVKVLRGYADQIDGMVQQNSAIKLIEHKPKPSVVVYSRLPKGPVSAYA